MKIPLISLVSLSVTSAYCQSVHSSVSKIDDGDEDSIVHIEKTTNNLFALSFDTKPARTYRLLSAASLNTNVWISITNILGSGERQSLTVRPRGASTFFTFEERRNPLFGCEFYVDPNSPPAQWAISHAASEPTNAALMQKIATNATAMWLTGIEPDVSYDVTNRIAAAQLSGTVAIFTLYNIPHRDCGNFSSGGTTGDAYTNWVRKVARAMGEYSGLVILEPDALANLDCNSLSIEAKNERIALIREAVCILKNECEAMVYVDAGHSSWVTAPVMADRLLKAGITNANGFALNVSNFQSDKDTIAYGTALSRLLNDIHFVIDSSRNGLGPYKNTADPQSWCNPPDRALGVPPTYYTKHALVDAYLWIKNPGESDGNCRTNAPPAGTFWPEYALELAKQAQF